MRNRIIGVVAALGLSASSASAGEDRTVWIEVDQDSDSVALQVFAALEDGETGSFRLVSRKSGRSGAATSLQSGRIGQGNGGVAGPFSTSRFSLLSGEALEAELTVTTSTGRTLVDKVTAVSE